jgi:hypothetical protein
MDDGDDRGGDDAYMKSVCADTEAFLSDVMNDLAAVRPPFHRRFIARRLLTACAEFGPQAGNVDAASERDDTWSLVGWLRDLSMSRLTTAIANALENGNTKGATDLCFLRRLGEATPAAGKRQLLELLIDGGAVEALAGELWAGIEELMAARAATAAELSSKFEQDGAGTLSYSGLETFFRGLEGALTCPLPCPHLPCSAHSCACRISDSTGRIGAPDPRVEESMALEHMEGDDAHEPFHTPNYGVKTTSATEWAFVAGPENEPEGGWPLEDKLRDGAAGAEALVAAGAKPRGPMAHSVMKARVEEKNAQLREMKEPPLIMAEAFGARLYTGPLFIKYNGLLRGLDSDVPFLVNTMIQLCCKKSVASEYQGSASMGQVANGTLSQAEARKQLNMYTTTLRAHLSLTTSSSLQYSQTIESLLLRFDQFFHRQALETDLCEQGLPRREWPRATRVLLASQPVGRQGRY